MYCFIVLFYGVFCVVRRPYLRDIFHTPVARYSLFVLKVGLPLNTSQLTNYLTFHVS